MVENGARLTEIIRTEPVPNQVRNHLLEWENSALHAAQIAADADVEEDIQALSSMHCAMEYK